MQPCSLRHAYDLLQICQREDVKCSVEIRNGGYLDCFVSIVDEVPILQYEELSDGDCMTVDMGNTQISFEVTSQFFKDIDGRQIMIAVANDRYDAFFNSGLVSRKGIQQAKSLIDIDHDDDDE